MTCITYLNGTLMADRCAVIDNNSLPVITDASKLFISEKGDLAMVKSSVIITNADAQKIMDLARPFFVRGEREIPIKTFEPVLGSRNISGEYSLFIMSNKHIYTTLNSSTTPVTRHSDDIDYPVVDGSGYVYMMIALNNGLSLDDSYAFAARNDWRVGKVTNKVTMAELKSIEEEQSDVNADNPQ